MRPPGAAPDLIVTNPPLGRRVQRSASLAPLLDRFVAHAARVLAPGGRIAWISPFPDRSREVAAASGLTLAHAFEVDLGGFYAEMQLLEAPATRS
jgi:tRNA G10  N-methylase Trm11